MKKYRLSSMLLLVLISMFILCSLCGFIFRAKEQSHFSHNPPKIIWWGVMSFEINVEDVIMHVDPFFRIHRRGDYILCSNQYPDHSSVSTKERILSISPNLKIILEPDNCKSSETLRPYTKNFVNGDVFEDDNFYVKAFYGFVSTPKDLIFLIYSKKADIWILHGGDATDCTYDSFREAFAEIKPKRIDYYLCTLGKISIDYIKELVKEFEPKVLIPAHYPYYIIDITDDSSRVQFPEEGVPYLRPEYSVEEFMSILNKWIAQEEIDTTITQVRPGEELYL
ncbi:MAG: hypothetical protein DRP84_02125 [Spirochaetes bacterium]|nr:MAG: hypothetical protein DRP84_02125 [Spirochaetota bacterium]